MRVAPLLQRDQHIHRMPASAVNTAAQGSARPVRVQVVTPPGALTREVVLERRNPRELRYPWIIRNAMVDLRRGSTYARDMKRLSTLVLVLATLGLIAACHREPPSTTASPAPTPSASAAPLPAYVADIRFICDVPNDDMVKRVQAGMDPSQLGRLMAERINKTITTDEARAFFKTLTPQTMSPGARATKLREEGTRVGVTPCAYAEWYQQYAH
jgi:hypothetical protein